MTGPAYMSDDDEPALVPAVVPFTAPEVVGGVAGTPSGVVTRPVLHRRSLDALTRRELQSALEALLRDHRPVVAEAAALAVSR